jgi:uncharacterized protein (DUF1501 family)
MIASLTRRNFLSNASSAVALSTLGPGIKGAFAADVSNTSRDILVVVFLRFGADGLTLVPPAGTGLYHDNRAVTGVSEQSALPLGVLDGVPLFLHPMMPELKQLYQAGNLAVVHAAGLSTESRSHFVSQDKIERAIADGEPPLSGGWLGRHLLARNLVLPGLGAITQGPDIDVALQGYNNAVSVTNIALFNVQGGDINLNLIEAMNTGPEPAVASARATVATIRTVQSKLSALVPATNNDAGYTGGDLSTSLKSVANIIKANVGLEVATVDFGGWDHHNNLNQYFPDHAAELSQGLAAFWRDMKDYRGRLTVVALTEFGRRLQENASAGLDHGSASVMFALGGNVNGGRIYGQWPGLAPADLHAGDLSVTTDYRQVLQEILVKRRAETTPQAVFPTLSYRPLGIVAG